MEKEVEEKNELTTIDMTANAVQVIKDAILQSQQKALKAVNQEQLALYYGIGHYISENTRNKNCGKGINSFVSTNNLRLTLQMRYKKHGRKE